MQCIRCGKENEAQSTQCRFCGATLPAIPEGRHQRWRRNFSELPSFVQLLLGLLAIVAVVAIPILFVTGVAMLPGFASAIFLVSGFFFFRGLHHPAGYEKTGIGSTGLAIAIGFYALMGMAVDQRGNPLYNAPLELFCPSESQLNQGTVISHPLPERTQFTQDFRCLDNEGSTVLVLSPFYILGVRLLEYIVLGYSLFYLTGFFRRRTS